jgi:hypothetical protein
MWRGHSAPWAFSDGPLRKPPLLNPARRRRSIAGGLRRIAANIYDLSPDPVPIADPVANFRIKDLDSGILRSRDGGLLSFEQGSPFDHVVHDHSFHKIHVPLPDQNLNTCMAVDKKDRSPKGRSKKNPAKPQTFHPKTHLIFRSRVFQPSPNSTLLDLFFNANDTRMEKNFANRGHPILLSRIS